MNTKYDWSNVPKEVKWIATDDIDGAVCGYEFMPYLMGDTDYWIPHSGDRFLYLIDIKPFKGNWKDSLEQRPLTP